MALTSSPLARRPSPLSGAARGLASLWPWGWLAAVVVAGVVYFAPVLYAGLAAVGLLAALLLLYRPVWGAYALVLSVPVQKAVSYDAGPIEITVTQVLFVVVLAIWWAWLCVRQDRRFVLTPIAVALLVFYVALLPSLWGTTSLPQSLAELSRWLVAIFSYIIITNSVLDRGQMNRLIAAMTVSAMFEAVVGLVQAYSGVGPASFSVEGELTRAYGTIGAPNSFAGYIDMTLPLAIALSVYLWARFVSSRKAPPSPGTAPAEGARTLWKPLGMTLIAVTLFYTVLTTLSRGAWIGLTFGLLVMILLLGRRAAALAVSTLVAAGGALAGLGAIGALPGPITERVGLLISQLQLFDPRGVTPTPENFALVERMAHWFAAGNMFLHSPWTGVGIGNFNVLFSRYGPQGWPISAGHAHNFYLHMLAETGIVGTTFYLALLITAVAVGVRAVRKARTRGDLYGEAIAIGALGILVTFMVHNLFEDLHVLNMGIHWGAALALFTFVARDSERLMPGKGRSTRLAQRG